jgi:hypothetical protein
LNSVKQFFNSCVEHPLPNSATICSACVVGDIGWILWDARMKRSAGSQWQLMIARIDSRGRKQRRVMVRKGRRTSDESPEVMLVDG